jgi:hypothetical protein
LGKEAVMLRRVAKGWKNLLCCTGFELVTQTIQAPNPSLAAQFTFPVNVTCPAGKYMVDQVPSFFDPSGKYPDWLVAQHMWVDGDVTTTTLPDGRAVPTGWKGNVLADAPAPIQPTMPVGIQHRCINA